jgi:small conductance mechanosensitive channel
MPATEEFKRFIIQFFTQYGIQIVGACVILAAGWLLAKLLTKALDEWLTKKKMEPPLRLLICRALRVLIFGFTLIPALDKFGVEIMPLVAGMGVGIGLAMQGVLSNVVAGLTIIFTKPFRVGEWVEMLDEQGKVVSIELFTTILEHPDMSKVVIPNRKIVGEILHNYGNVRQLDLNVGVAYATDLDRALAAVQEVLAAHPKALKDPAPVLGVTALADSSINLSVKPWVSVDDYGAAHRELYKQVVEKFREAGVEIPFPQREIRVLGEPPSLRRMA